MSQMSVFTSANIDLKNSCGWAERNHSFIYFKLVMKKKDIDH